MQGCFEEREFIMLAGKGSGHRCDCDGTSSKSATDCD
jgi:hypothetical protein